MTVTCSSGLRAFRRPEAFSIGHSERPEGANMSSTPFAAPDIARPPQKRNTWRLIFRIVRWSTYAAAVITLLLMFHSAPAPVIPTSPQAAARMEEKLQSAGQSLATGNSATLRFNETELNSYLATHLELAPRRPATRSAANRSPADNAATAPDPTAAVSTPPGTTAEQVAQVRSTVRDVKVQLIDDRARAYVVFDFHGKDVTLQLEGRLRSSGGYLRFEPVSGQFGSLPIPQSALESAVQKVMNTPENREKFKLPPEVSDLRIENGDVVLTYR
jgi:hypothetical protein